MMPALQERQRSDGGGGETLELATREVGWKEMGALGERGEAAEAQVRGRVLGVAEMVLGERFVAKKGVHCLYAYVDQCVVRTCIRCAFDVSMTERRKLVQVRAQELIIKTTIFLAAADMCLLVRA